MRRFASRAFFLADIGEGITECRVLRWFVNVGDKVKEFDKICEVQSDKAVVDISSRFEGVIEEIHYKVNDTAIVGTPLVTINSKDETIHSKDKKPIVKEEKEEERKLAAPSVRALARSLKINLEDVQGSGKDGRVLAEDLKSFSSSPFSPSESSSSSFSPVQKAMFNSMSKSLQVPHLLYCDSVILDQTLMAKGHVSTLAMLLKTFSLALLKFPILNHGPDHNTCVAIDSKSGLMVPNIKKVQSLSIDEIDKELKRLKQSAVEGKMSLQDTLNGSITVSNIGSISGTYMKPLIVPPQVCIVALGRGEKTPVVVNDSISIATVMPLSFSADHRVVDGATVAKFSNLWKSFILNPNLLLKNMK